MTDSEKSVLAETIAAYSKFIELLLRSDDRNRFSRIQTLAMQCQTLQVTFDGSRVGDYDDGMPIGAAVPVPRRRPIEFMGGDNMELLRVIIDSIGPILKSQNDRATSEMRTNLISELDGLLRLKATMAETGDEITDDIATRIDYLKTQIAKDEGDQNAVVPVEFLRS